MTNDDANTALDVLRDLVTIDGEGSSQYLGLHVWPDGHGTLTIDGAINLTADQLRLVQRLRDTLEIPENAEGDTP